MVLPAETEQRVKRRAMSACRDSLRKVLDVNRKIPQMVELFLKDDKEAARNLFIVIQKGGEEVVKARRLVSQELSEIGAILLSREDFLRFTNLSSEIGDFSVGIAYYLLEIMEHKWKVPEDIKKDLLKLADAVLESVLKLREVMMVLTYGFAKTLEKATDVEIAERTVDSLFRALTIKILTSKIDTPVLLLLRDILQMLENSADKAEDAADAARMLSFRL